MSTKKKTLIEVKFPKIIIYENTEERIICTPETERETIAKFEAWGYNMTDMEEDENGDFHRFEIYDNFIVMTSSGLDNYDVESNFEEPEVVTNKKKK